MLPPVFADRLTTTGVGAAVLRSPTETDWRLEMQLSKDPEVVRWTLIPADLTEEQARARTRRRSSAIARGSLGFWIIEHEGTAVGSVGAGLAGPNIEIFYALLASARGKGLASAAVAAVVESLKSQDCPLVVATYPDNRASQNTARRAGFRPSGSEFRLINGDQRLLLTWTYVVA